MIGTDLIERHAVICNNFYNIDNPLDVVGDTDEFTVLEAQTYGVHEWILYTDTVQFFLLTRGSEELLDWVTNFRIKKVNTPFGKIHRGFWEACDFAHKFQNLDQLTCIGHSKGGAMAQILALRTRQRMNQIRRCITWGSPRVGDERFAQYINGIESVRVANFWDIVTHIPVVGYQHGGRRVFQNSLQFPFYKNHLMSSYLPNI